MTEREKMLAGELYLASDPELAASRLRARRLVRTFNNLDEDQIKARQSTLTELLGSTGKDVEVEPPFRCDYGWNIFLGDGVFANFGCVLLDCAPIRIGDGTLLAPGVHIYAAHHPLDADVRKTLRELATPVSIGQNVWIGGAAKILPGVCIGDNSVIGAGSVVTRDVPEGVVAAGVPCRVLHTV